MRPTSVLLLALVLAPGLEGASSARAQVCVDAQDGAVCEDDLDPCTDDRCDDGACEHVRVGFPEACAPVLSPFRRVVVLDPFAAGLTTRIGALPVGDPPAFTSGQRAALVQDLANLRATLADLQATLGGFVDDAGDTAQARAKAAMEDAGEALRLAVLVRDLVRAAAHASQFPNAVAVELERSTADLVRAAKDVRRDLARLRKVSQVFRS
jgi:hypothetical protein